MSEPSPLPRPGLVGAKPQPPMVGLRYIGPKPVKRDTVRNTKVVWNGPGDVQDVPADTVARYLKHPAVWQLADADWTPPVLQVVTANLGDLVRAAQWETIERIAPEAFEEAKQFFRARQAMEGAGEFRRAHPTVVSGWARDLLNGSGTEIRGRLEDQAALLLEQPDLFEALGVVESEGKNRRNVLDLIESAEAAALSGQTSLIDPPGQSEQTA